MNLPQLSLKCDARMILILRTKASTVRGKLVLFEDHLVTIGLEGGWRIWRLCEDEICIVRVTLDYQRIVSLTIVTNTYRQLGILLKECMIPDSFLSFPIDKEALIDRPTKGNFTKVIAFL